MRWFYLLVVVLLARGSTFAQVDSIFIEQGGVIVKKCLVSDIDWITFSPTLVAVEDEDLNQNTPTQFTLSQNYPNPFNPSTQIRCYIPSSGNVQVRIFDINGSLVNEIYSGEKSQGEHVFYWDAKNARGNYVASGVYLYTVQFNDSQLTKKIIYLK